MDHRARDLRYRLCTGHIRKRFGIGRVCVVADRAINKTLDAGLAVGGGWKRPTRIWFSTPRYEKVREADVIRPKAVHIAIGIDWEGRRQVLAVELANRESMRLRYPNHSLPLDTTAATIRSSRRSKRAAVKASMRSSRTRSFSRMIG